MCLKHYPKPSWYFVIQLALIFCSLERKECILTLQIILCSCIKSQREGSFTFCWVMRLASRPWFQSHGSAEEILCASPTLVILLLQFYEKDNSQSREVMNLQGCEFKWGQLKKVTEKTEHSFKKLVPQIGWSKISDEWDKLLILGK